MKFFWSLSLAAIICSATLAAEIEVRLLAENLHDDQGQVVLADGEWTSKPFDLAMNNLTPAQGVPGRTLRLLAAQGNKELAKIALPEGADSFVILLLTQADQTYASAVIRFGDPAFAGGDLFVYNHADHAVLGLIGSTKFTLKPSKQAMISPEGPKDDKFFDVELAVREKDKDKDKDKDKVRVFSTTKWPVNEKVRTYLLFFTHPKTKRVSYRAVQEFLKP